MTEYTEPPTRNYHREIVEERDRLRIENERLQERNTSLAKENFNLFELLNENDRLRKQLQAVIAANGIAYIEHGTHAGIQPMDIRGATRIVSDTYEICVENGSPGKWKKLLGDTNT